MPFNINEFTAQLTGKGSGSVARQSHFDVNISNFSDKLHAKITDPKLVNSTLKRVITTERQGRLPWSIDTLFQSNESTLKHQSDDKLNNNLRFRIDTAEFPGRSILSTPYVDYGLPRKMAVGSNVVESSITVICSKDLREKVFFEIWQDVIAGKYRQPNKAGNPVSDQFAVGYYEDYTATVEINQYDDTGARSYSCTLMDCYPQLVGPLPLSWASEELHRLTVVLTYRYFIDQTHAVPDKPAKDRWDIGIRDIVVLGAQAAATIKSFDLKN